MLTYNGVMRLFHSKSEQWVLGIWIEILLFQIVTAFLILYDAITHSQQIYKIIAVAALILDIFLPSFALLIYFALRIAISCSQNTAVSAWSSENSLKTSKLRQQSVVLRT